MWHDYDFIYLFIYSFIYLFTTIYSTKSKTEAKGWSTKESKTPYYSITPTVQKRK